MVVLPRPHLTVLRGQFLVVITPIIGYWVIGSFAHSSSMWWPCLFISHCVGSTLFWHLHGLTFAKCFTLVSFLEISLHSLFSLSLLFPLRRAFLLSLLFFRTLHSDGYIFTFSFAFLFSFSTSCGLSEPFAFLHFSRDGSGATFPVQCQNLSMSVQALYGSIP